MHTTSHTPLALTLLATLAGCGLPALPMEEDPDAGGYALDMEVDLSLDSGDVPVSPPTQCSPLTRQCRDASTVQVCAEDGRRWIEHACEHPAMRCEAGRCVNPLCKSGMIAHISQPSLSFDVREDLKTTTAQLTLYSCDTSALRLHTLQITGPEHDDGSPVFALAESPIGPGLELSPGDAVTLKVAMRPRDRALLDEGRLDLTLIGSTITSQSIPLHTTQRCLGHTPMIDLGVVPAGETITREITLYNCARQPLTVRGRAAQVPRPDAAVVDVGELRGGVTIDASTQRKVTAQTHTLTVRRDTPGPISALVTLELDPLDTSRLIHEPPQIFIQGAAVKRRVDECARVPLALAQVLSQPWQIGDLSPLTDHSIALPRAEGWTPVVKIIDSPDPRGVQVWADTSALLFYPGRVGDYALEVMWTSPEGLRSCESGRLDLKVVPFAPLYVELAWETLGHGEAVDPVAQDTGSGRGVDLDLHVLFTRDGEALQAWRRPTRDCASSAASRDDWAPCAAGRGAFAPSSSSGAFPEAVAIWPDSTLGQFDAARLELAAHVHSLGVYDRARAHIRVWRLGQLVPELSMTRELTETDHVWLVGELVNPGRVGESAQPRGGLIEGFPRRTDGQ